MHIKMIMKGLAVIGVALLLVVQYMLWLGDGGYVRVMQLRSLVTEQINTNAALQLRNQELSARIKALRHNPQAIESLARTEVGMIKPGETLYRIVR